MSPSQGCARHVRISGQYIYKIWPRGRAVKSVSEDFSLDGEDLAKELEAKEFTIAAITRNLENVVAMHEARSRKWKRGG